MFERDSPLWLTIAGIGLVTILLTGYGAYYDLYRLPALLYAAMLGGFVALTLLLLPAGRRVSMWIPFWAIGYLVWSIASYAWAVNQSGWMNESLILDSTLVALVALAQFVRWQDLHDCVMIAGQIAIGLVFVTLVIRPGLAYHTSEGARGLDGAFIHKNAMAMCVLMTTAMVLTFHPRQHTRRWFVAGVVVMLLVGETTTGLSCLAVMLGTAYLIDRYPRMKQTLGRASGVLALGGVAVLVAAGWAIFANAVELSGKDLTFSKRTDIWDSVSRAVAIRPLAGYGHGVWINLYGEPAVTINQRIGFVVAEAHSAYWESRLRLGWVGFLLLAGGLVMLAVRAAKLVVAGHPLGKLTALFVVLMVLFGFSEASPSLGVWPALLATLGSFQLRELNLPTRQAVGAAPSRRSPIRRP